MLSFKLKATLWFVMNCCIITARSCLKLSFRNRLLDVRLDLGIDEIPIYTPGDSGKLDPEVYMNASQLIQSKGIPFERHLVTTKDGYILGMQRLSRRRSLHLQPYPVLIVHGVLSSSDGFLVNLRNQSLAYLLYDRGFDVWLGNIRGNKYSRRHKTLKPEDKEFWEWNFDQMGQFDIPIMIDHILRTTGKSKINYIGHSQGCVVLMAAVMGHGSKVADKVNKFFALAPSAYVAQMDTPLRSLSYFSHLITNFDNEFLPSHKLIQTYTAKYCTRKPDLCRLPLTWFCGPSEERNINETRLPVYVSHDPSGTSSQNMKHWVQMLDQEEVGMKYYDYGRWWKNFWHYGQFSTPSYDFSTFSVPTYVFCGTTDALVTLNDCASLTTIIPNVRSFWKIGGYSHADFILGIHAATDVYETIITDMREPLPLQSSVP